MRSKKMKYFRPFGPHFGVTIRGPPSPGSATGMSFFFLQVDGTITGGFMSGGGWTYKRKFPVVDFRFQRSCSKYNPDS